MAISPSSICGTETPTAFQSHLGRSFASTGPDLPAWFRSKPTRAIQIWWWSAPLTLAVDTQMARIEFNPQRLTVNGDAGVRTSDIVAGRSYLLTLNVSRFSPETASLWVQQVIPLVRIDVHDAGISTEVLSGIVGIEHREVGAQSRWLDYSGVIGWEIDLTPWPEAPETAP